MKITRYACLFGLFLAAPLASAQNPPPAQPADRPSGPEVAPEGARVGGSTGRPGRRLVPAFEALNAAPAPAPAPAAPLRRFNLNFSGGRPDDLVKAIEQAMGKPLNAIIPGEYADTHLPPLRLNEVTVPELFTALQMASQKKVAYVTGRGNMYPGMAGPASYQVSTTGYGFKTLGTQTDDSIWYFFREEPPVLPEDARPSPPKVCRFYQLAPYLDHCTVEDITTAVQTGWKMLGGSEKGGPLSELPKLSFHKETELLIAVGEQSQLELIDQVLAQLKTGKKGNLAPRQPIPVAPAAPPPMALPPRQ